MAGNRTEIEYQTNGEYELVRLELISLLNFDTPRVYVLDHLPRMDQLTSDDVETRELNQFEQAGLERLFEGETIEVEATAERLRMVGGLRAIEDCKQCHNAARGDLLGAFSYEFVAI